MNTDKNMSDGTSSNSSKNKGLYIGAAILAGVALLAGSFLIGQFVGITQEENNKKDNDSSQVADKDEEVSDVFDSTDEEIEAIKEEQEKVEEELEKEKLEVVNEESPEISYTQSTAIPECGITISSVEGVAIPTVGAKEGIPLGDFMNIKCFNLPLQVVGGTITNNIDQLSGEVINQFFDQESQSKILRAVVNDNPNTNEDSKQDSYYFETEGFTYQIDVLDNTQVNFNDVKISIADKDEVVVPAVVTTETYTNPFFTDFKLVYPSDWEFRNETSVSGFDKLLNRKIRLLKNDHVLELSLSPFTTGGCGGPTPQPDFLIQNSDFEVYIQERDSEELYWITNGACSLSNMIKTNIKSDFSNDYNSLAGDRDTVEYQFYMNLTTVTGDPINDVVFEEVESILQNSSIK